MNTSTATDRTSLLELDLPGDTAPTPASSEYGEGFSDSFTPGMLVNNRAREQDWSDMAPAPTTSAGFGDTVVLDASRDLALAEKAVAEAAGFVVDRDQLFFDEGTALMDSGHAKLRREARKFLAKPTLDEAAAAHDVIIAAERRKTSTVKLADWRLDIEGKLRTVTTVDGALRYGPSAITIADHALKQAAGYAEGSTGPNANTWLGSIEGEQRLRARTRKDGVREAFAVLGPESTRGYVEFDTDRVLNQAAKQLAGLGLKADVRYSEASTRMTARLYVQAPVDIPAFSGVGRVHQAGVILRAADNGSLSIQAESFLIRIRCLNATLVRAKGGAKVRVRHVGDVSRMGEVLRGAIDQVTEMLPELTALWQRAAVEHYVDKASGTQLGMRDAFVRLVAQGHLPKGGLGLEGAVEAYMSAWREEDSPTNSMGVIMAAQRAAHETTWRTQWAEDEVIEAASQLLYQPVTVLAEARS